MPETPSVADFLDEITPEALEALNELMATGPGEGASAEEVEAFMEGVLKSEGGLRILPDLIAQLREGNLFGKLERQPLGYVGLSSPVRVIFRVAQGEGWFLMSLPSDCAFIDLRYAIEDCFPDVGELWEFLIREEGEVVERIGGLGEESVCEIQNSVSVLMEAGVVSFELSSRKEGPTSILVSVEGLLPQEEVATIPKMLQSSVQGEKVVFRDPSSWESA